MHMAKARVDRHRIPAASYHTASAQPLLQLSPHLRLRTSWCNWSCSSLLEP
jgi:hypothetical protein